MARAAPKRDRVLCRRAHPQSRGARRFGSMALVVEERYPVTEVVEVVMEGPRLVDGGDRDDRASEDDRDDHGVDVSHGLDRGADENEGEEEAERDRDRLQRLRLEAGVTDRSDVDDESRDRRRAEQERRSAMPSCSDRSAAGDRRGEPGERERHDDESVDLESEREVYRQAVVPDRDQPDDEDERRRFPSATSRAGRACPEERRRRQGGTRRRRQARPCRPRRGRPRARSARGGHG